MLTSKTHKKMLFPENWFFPVTMAHSFHFYPPDFSNIFYMTKIWVWFFSNKKLLRIRMQPMIWEIMSNKKKRWQWKGELCIRYFRFFSYDQTLTEAVCSFRSHADSPYVCITKKRREWVQHYNRKQHRIWMKFTLPIKVSRKLK